MIINFQFQQNRRLDPEILTSGKSFKKFDVEFKQFEKIILTFEIFREDSDLHSKRFYIENLY